jgi:chemotaxis protein MotC
MIALRPSVLTATTGIVLLSFAVGSAAAGLEAEPYKLVRSLQRIQDQIADGDKQAVGMQLELTKLVDRSFRRVDRQKFADPKTARALIVYSMLGGNPQTLEQRLADMGEPGSPYVRLGVAILSYQKGASQKALAQLKAVDPLSIGGMFGASLALIRGLITENDEEARHDFDAARLLAPGTLVEEAALRRLMSIHRRSGNPEAFLRVSSRYARRFVASPYALQYAQEFTAGVVAMGDRMDTEQVVEILEFLPDAYRESLTLRLLHNATLDGKSELVARIAAFAPAHAAEDIIAEVPPDPSQSAVRQDFYAKVSQVTSENVREVADELRRIDVETLSEGERNLLRAVLAVADAVTDPEAALPETEPMVQEAGARESILYEAPKQQVEPVLQDFEDFVGGTRSTLESLDKLLEEIQ